MRPKYAVAVAYAKPDKPKKPRKKPTGKRNRAPDKRPPHPSRYGKETD